MSVAFGTEPQLRDQQEDAWALWRRDFWHEHTQALLGRLYTLEDELESITNDVQRYYAVQEQMRLRSRLGRLGVEPLSSGERWELLEQERANVAHPRYLGVSVGGGYGF